MAASVGREQLGRGPVAALLGGQPLVELDARASPRTRSITAWLSEPRVSGPPALVQRRLRPDAVAEVALGGRAEAGVRVRLAEVSRCRRR